MSIGEFASKRSIGDNLFGETTLEGGMAAVIKRTYLLLSLCVGAAMAGGFIGATSPFFRDIFMSPIGWIGAIIVINVVPRVAIALCRTNPLLGFAGLLLNGFVSGLVLAPALAYAVAKDPDIVTAAIGITGFVFLGVTLYVMTSGRKFSAPRGLMAGLFFSIIGVMVLNMFLNIGILGLLLSGAIGVFGVFVLVYATSDVLNNPQARSAVPGALMLFAGLFNVFVAALHILLRLWGGGRN